MDAKLVIDGKEYLIRNLTQDQQLVAQQLAASQQKSMELSLFKNKEDLWQTFLISQLRDSMKPEQLEMDLGDNV